MPKLAASSKPVSNGKVAAKGFSVKKVEREILYPEVTIRKCYGKEALTFDQVKKILGWSESPNPELPDEPHLFKDYHGKPIWCHNVVTPTYRNRYLTWSNVLALKQEHLRGHWMENGESLIIGKSGFVIDGQHQMIAFCLACQEWNAEKEDWCNWKSEPTFPKLVVFGINEDDKTVNSINTGKMRSLPEVIERSKIFEKLKGADRKECAKYTDHAVRLLWHRLGVKLDAFAPRRTHSEAMEFIGNHPKLLECVKHIFEENKDSKIVDVLTPGYAAALMYLMSSSNTSPEKYHDAETYSEANADLSNYNHARDFFVEISDDNPSMAPLRSYIVSLKRDALDTRDARMAVLIKAWLLFVQEKKLTAEGLKLNFTMEGDINKLAECPTTGGIDRGNPKDDLTEDEPTEDEIKEHKATEASIRQSKENGKPAAKGLNTSAPKKTSKKSTKIEVGDTVWVRDSEDDGGGVWDGELQEIYEANGKPVGRVKSNGTGKIFDAPVERMSHTEPL